MVLFVSHNTMYYLFSFYLINIFWIVCITLYYYLCFFQSLLLCIHLICIFIIFCFDRQLFWPKMQITSSFFFLKIFTHNIQIISDIKVSFMLTGVMINNVMSSWRWFVFDNFFHHFESSLRFKPKVCQMLIIIIKYLT